MVSRGTSYTGMLMEQEYSLVLLDYAMPGCSGEELLTQIVEHYPKLPVVMMTGFDQVDTGTRCMEIGAKKFLIKTFDEKALLAAIEAKEIAGDPKVSKVSVVGVGMRSHVGVASKMFRTLSEEGINILMISTSEIKISVVIDEKYMELAVRALHKAFELDQK